MNICHSSGIEEKKSHKVTIALIVFLEGEKKGGVGWGNEAPVEIIEAETFLVLLR